MQWKKTKRKRIAESAINNNTNKEMTAKDFFIYIVCPAVAAIIAGIILEAFKGFPIFAKFKKKPLKSNNKIEEDGVPEFVKYTKDTIDGFILKWNWALSPNGWQIRNLRICCPVDETPLVVENMFYIICPRCKKEYYNTPDLNNARIIIEDNIIKRYGAILV